MQRLTRHLNCASFVSSTAAFEHRFDFRHHFFILMLSSEEESLIRLNFQETPYRFLIVILYSLLAMVVGLSYSAYASISPQIQQVLLSLFDPALQHLNHSIQPRYLCLPYNQSRPDHPLHLHSGLFTSQN